jgi:hypothetical protein
MATIPPYSGGKRNMYSIARSGSLRRVLFIVASSAPSERVFSCVGNKVTNKRFNFPLVQWMWWSLSKRT